MNKFFKTLSNIILYIISFIWQLPQNIVALVMIPFLGKKRCIWRDKWCSVYVCEKMMGGISLGNFIFLSERVRDDLSVAHELGHCVDSRIFGPLYLLIIGLPSIIHTFHNCDFYYHFYTERWANKHMGIETEQRGGRKVLVWTPNYYFNSHRVNNILL